MGNYVFTTEALIDAVTADAADEAPSTTSAATSSRCSSTAARRRSTTSRATRCPARPTATAATGATSGTLDAYYDAHMDLISVDPIFNLYNREWPILTWPEPLPPAKFVFDGRGRTRPGARLDGLRRRRDLGRHGAPLGALARRAPALLPLVEDSILMHGVEVGRHAVVRRAILDKNVTIAPGAQIGVDPRRPRALHVSAGGVVVIAKGADGEA
jgi:glucose-1-phosphate adenylyltransferase